MFIPAGLGNISTSHLYHALSSLASNLLNTVGAPLAGRLSDYMVVHWREKRGQWVPEDRLRAALSGALLLAPLSILASGLLTQYVPGRLGLGLNLLCLLINGIGVRPTTPPLFETDIFAETEICIYHRSMSF